MGKNSKKDELGCIKLDGNSALTVCSTGLSSLFKCVKTVSMPEIEKVIYQKDFTIVVWADDERTVVRCSEEDFDKEKGLAMAIAKRFMDRNKFKKLIKEASIQNK